MALSKVALFLAVIISLSIGCKREPAGETNPLESGGPAKKSAVSSTSAEIRAAQDSAKKGALDDAAAKLLLIRAKSTDFSQAEATQYRQTLADTYSRALEAASKGDPKAQAAVQMLRASGPKNR